MVSHTSATMVLHLPTVLVLDANVFKPLKQTGNVAALKVFHTLATELGFQLLTCPSVFDEAVTGGPELALPRGLLATVVGVQKVDAHTPMADKMRTHAREAHDLPVAEADFELFLLSKVMAQQKGLVGLVTNDEGIRRLVGACVEFPGEIQLVEPVAALGYFIRFCRTGYEEDALIKATRDLADHFIRYRLQTRRDISTVISSLLDNMRPSLAPRKGTRYILGASNRRAFSKAVHGMSLTPEEASLLASVKPVTAVIRQALEARDSESREMLLGEIRTQMALVGKTLSSSEHVQLVAEVQDHLYSIHMTQFRVLFEQGNTTAAIDQLDMAADAALVSLAAAGVEELAVIKLLKALLFLALGHYVTVQTLLNDCRRLESPVSDQLAVFDYIAGIAVQKEGAPSLPLPPKLDWQELELLAKDLEYLGNQSLAGRVYAAILAFAKLPGEARQSVARSLLLCARLQWCEPARLNRLLAKQLPQADLADLTTKPLDTSLLAPNATPVAKAPRTWLAEMHIIDTWSSAPDRLEARVWHPILQSRVLLRLQAPLDPRLTHARSLRLVSGTIRGVSVEPSQTSRWNVRAIVELEGKAEIEITMKKLWLPTRALVPLPSGLHQPAVRENSSRADAS
jgi:hypothetical protein